MSSYLVLTVKDVDVCPTCGYAKCKVNPSVAGVITDWVSRYHQRCPKDVIRDYRKTIDGGFIFGHGKNYNIFNVDLLGGFPDEDLDRLFTRDTKLRLYLPNLPARKTYCTKCATKLKRL